MVKNLNILFYLRRDKEDDKGLVPIYCRITVDGKRSELSLKRYVDPSRWIPGKEMVSGSREDSKSVNSMIESVRLNIHNHIKDMEHEGETITAQSIKNAYLGIKDNFISLISVFSDHNQKLRTLIGRDFAEATYDRYETCLNHLREFIKIKYQQDDFSITEIDNLFVTELDYYLRATKNCANNTTIKYIKNFKKIVRLSMANGWITKDPFVNYKAKLDKVDRGYLTEEELTLLSNKEISFPRLDQVRDGFLFQCFTGLAYIDVKKLKKEHIVKGVDGNLWIRIYRTKTNTQENVPIIPEAMSIIEKYKNHPESINKDVLLPILSNQKMNAYLKEIADICGITKRLSTHLARHTFATTITLANGVSLESVSKMLGHTNINTTKIYARMMDSRVAEEMAALKSKRSLKLISNG